ncbi:MAG TPA: hypothetical protein DEH25_15100, partial [Chloroflexi bacterium]|nr:hypothetical protein [Chloroflexota bacterium]
DDLLNGSKPTVRVGVAAPAAAARVLQSLPGVESIQSNGSSILVKGVESQVIMSHLLQHNIIPTELTAQKSDLESLFMDVTAP